MDTEVFVCVGDALEKLFLELVLFRIWIPITAAPKVFYDLFALVVSRELLPCVVCRLREDKLDVIDPFDVNLLEFSFILRGCSSGLRVVCGAGIVSFENEPGEAGDESSERRGRHGRRSFGEVNRLTEVNRFRTVDGETTFKKLNY